MDRAVSSRNPNPFGRLLRDWRRRSGYSQLRLAVEADVSPRHLSFIETGRARPSRDMVLRLGEALGVPLRDRNGLLIAAGFAARFRETSIGEAVLAPIERMLDFLLERQEPFPAYLLDHTFRVLRSNRAGLAVFQPFLRDDPVWREAPLNLLRLTLHPEGLRPAIVNFDEVASALLLRLSRSISLSGGDEDLVRLADELRSLPGLPDPVRISDSSQPAPPILAVHMKSGEVSLRFFSLLTTVGTPQDVTLQHLHIESFMPADEASEAWMRTRTAAREVRTESRPERPPAAG